ncbi:MAG: hypothetical protein D6748_13960, partial [Calditrichaeota bacterium]
MNATQEKIRNFNHFQYNDFLKKMKVEDVVNFEDKPNIEEGIDRLFPPQHKNLLEQKHFLDLGETTGGGHSIKIHPGSYRIPRIIPSIPLNCIASGLI